MLRIEISFYNKDPEVEYFSESEVAELFDIYEDEVYEGLSDNCIQTLIDDFVDTSFSIDEQNDINIIDWDWV